MIILQKKGLVKQMKKLKRICMTTLMSCSIIISSTTNIYAATLNMDSIRMQIGDKYANQMQNRLEKSSEIIQDNWNTYADDIKFCNIDYEKGLAVYSYYSGISIDMKTDATRSLETQSKMKYANTFHEIGHSIAYILNDTFTDVKCDSISDTYKSEKYGCTMNEMLKKEGNSYFKKIRKKTTSNKKAWHMLNKELKSYPRTASYEISDIWDGLSNGKAYAYCAHTIAAKYPHYWNNVSVGCEAFADIYEASITNPKGVKLIKKYFPKSYEIFEEELQLKKNK